MAVMSVSAAMAEIKANPIKPYVYILRKPDLTPFYVGMGTGIRLFEHTRPKALSRRSRKSSIIKSIVRSGGEVIFEIFEFFESRELASRCERELIASIGREDVGTGPLANMTEGGEGVSGHSEDLKKRLSEITRLQMLDPARKAKMSAVATLRWQSDALFRQRHAAAMLISMNDPEIRKKISDGVRASNGEQRSANISASQKARWLDPENRRRLMDLKKDAEFRRRLSQSKTGKRHSEETKEKIRRIRTGTRRSPESIAKQRQYLIGRPVSVETRRKISESNKATALRKKLLAAR